MPAARQRVDLRFGVDEAGASEGERDAARPLVRLHVAQRRHDGVFDGGARREHRVLGDVADPDTTVHRARAAIGRLQVGEDLEERRLAGAVGANEARAIAREDPERHAREEGASPVRFRHVLASEQKRSAHPPEYRLRFTCSEGIR